MALAHSEVMATAAREREVEAEAQAEAAERARGAVITRLALRSCEVRWGLVRRTWVVRAFWTWLVRTTEVKMRAQLAAMADANRCLAHDLHFWSGHGEHGSDADGGGGRDGAGGGGRGHTVLSL